MKKFSKWKNKKRTWLDDLLRFTGYATGGYPPVGDYDLAMPGSEHTVIRASHMDCQGNVLATSHVRVTQQMLEQHQQEIVRSVSSGFQAVAAHMGVPETLPERSGRITIEQIRRVRDRLLLQRVNPLNFYIDPSSVDGAPIRQADGSLVFETYRYPFPPYGIAPKPPLGPPKPLTHRQAIKRRIARRSMRNGKPMLSFKTHDDSKEFYKHREGQGGYRAMFPVAGWQENPHPMPPHPWPGEARP